MSYGEEGHGFLPGVAVIGMAGRFPGARDIDEFWRNLREGRETVRHFTVEELSRSGLDATSIKDNPNYVRARGALDDIDQFDASFFGCNPREARLLDPQQRLWLECAWEALENAGHAPDQYKGSIGVFAGGRHSTYLLHYFCGSREMNERLVCVMGADAYQILMSNDKDSLSTRTSYKLNLHGPSVSVQTACSTSLVAVAQACQSLLSYQADMCLAGGVCVTVPPVQGYLYEEGGIYSPDGHCRAFDARARGAVFGDGVGVVVLKRLEDAITDGDCIDAVIRGWAVNNDGSSKVGFTAPSVDGQAEAIAMAQAVAGVSPETVTYVEAHGTGTALGDPIEIAALTKAFRAHTKARQFCGIGSVKTNIGHLDAAAGVAGLIKTILALKHGQIPPSLHFETPNPALDLASSPFYVVTALTEWKTTGVPRRAGVSSFGVGGTNCHVVLEEAPAPLPAIGPIERSQHVLALAAKSESALRQLAERYAMYLTARPDVALADLGFTANTGRSHHAYRLAVVAKDAGQLREDLSAFVGGRPETKVAWTSERSDGPPRVAFLFTGQGSQFIGMGRELYETQPTFREAMRECDAILRPYLEQPLIQVLFPDRGGSSPLDETAYTQPALFSLEYALARLWRSWGVEPAAVMGHSVGEYVAACVAGVFSLDDGLRLIAERGRLMQALPRDGEMVAVFAKVPLVLEAIAPYAHEVSLAAVNDPEHTVISGRRQAIRAIVAALQIAGAETKRLRVSHAFHSPRSRPCSRLSRRRSAGRASLSPG